MFYRSPSDIFRLTVHSSQDSALKAHQIPPVELSKAQHYEKCLELLEVMS